MFHYIAWPDFGVPKDPFLLFEMIHMLSKLNVNCTVVHCSAGVGRTGVFIALAKLVEKLHTDICHVEIFQTVLDLRNNRKFMVSITDNLLVGLGLITAVYLVMNIEQYKFLYSAVSAYMTMLEEE